MNVANKLVLPTMLLGMSCAFGADIPSGADLASMNDYYYYLTAGTSDRAEHALKHGGEYTLSADKVWSALAVGTVLDEPAVLNLGGHTLTLNGCDATGRPLTGNDNSTLVISNGTIQTVYDTETYPWTKDHSDWYVYRRSVLVSRNNSSAVGSRLVVANGGNLIVEDGGRTIGWAGNGHTFIVEKGGTFDGKLGFSGKDNRYVFKSGSTFSKISDYISSGHGFPQNIWFEEGYTSNILEVCDSDMLTAAGVTSLTPDANAKKGSFHCGFAVSSPNFHWSGGGISIGTRFADSPAPVVFEMKDGATMTMTGEFHLGPNKGGSGSWATLDGAGTTYQCTGQWGGRVGAGKGVTNLLLRLTNGAMFAVPNGTFVIGYDEGTSSNAMEVLSGAHFANRTFTIGRTANYGNRVLVAGEGSTMTNTRIEVGSSLSGTGGGGGGHSLTVADHGSVFVKDGGTTPSSTWSVQLGYHCGGCLLEITDDGRMTIESAAVYLGYGDRVAGCSNRVVVSNGGSLSATAFMGYGNNSELVVSNGTVSTSGSIYFCTNGLVSVSGQHSFLQAASGGMDLRQGGTLKIAVPKSGFTDSNGVPRAPVNITGSVSFDDALTFEIDVSEMGQRHDAVKETPLLYVSNGISDDLLAKITVVGENCNIKRSSDGKTLKAIKPSGFIMLVL